MSPVSSAQKQTTAGGLNYYRSFKLILTLRHQSQAEAWRRFYEITFSTPPPPTFFLLTPCREESAQKARSSAAAKGLTDLDGPLFHRNGTKADGTVFSRSKSILFMCIHVVPVSHLGTNCVRMCYCVVLSPHTLVLNTRIGASIVRKCKEKNLITRKHEALLNISAQSKWSQEKKPTKVTLIHTKVVKHLFSQVMSSAVPPLQTPTRTVSCPRKSTAPPTPPRTRPTARTMTWT